MEVDLRVGTEKSTARLVGGLFLLAMAAAMAGNGLVLSIITDPEYLQVLDENNIRLRTAAVFLLVNSISVVAIGVLVYQLLKQIKPLSAAGYLAARIIESVVLIVGIISLLSLTTVAEVYTGEEAVDKSSILALAKSAIDINWYSYNIAMLVLGLGSLLFCGALFQLKLVPRYLSILGFLGYAVLASSSLLAILGFEPGLVVTLPVFVFEVVLGMWLMVKGYELSAF